MDAGFPAVVLDVGGTVTRAGVAREVVPTVVKRHTRPIYEFRDNERPRIDIDACVEEIASVLGGKPGYPDGLGLTTESFRETALLLTEPTKQISDSDREKLCAAIFEQLDVPALFFAKKGILATYACGKSSAISVGLGGKDATFAFVVQGSVDVDQHCVSFATGGDVLDGLVQAALGKSCPIDWARAQREQSLSVGGQRADAQPEMVSLKLPDGQDVMVDNVVEQWWRDFDFADKLVSRFSAESTSVADPLAAYAPAVLKSNLLFNGVVLYGGLADTAGLSGRLTEDLRASAQKPEHRKLTGVQEIQSCANGPFTGKVGTSRANAAWLGGSILLSMPDFQGLMLSYEEYGEHGPALINPAMSSPEEPEEAELLPPTGNVGSVFDAQAAELELQQLHHEKRLIESLLYILRQAQREQKNAHAAAAGAAAVYDDIGWD